MSQKQGRPSQTIESRFRKKEAETHRHIPRFLLKKRCRQFYACTLKFSFLLSNIQLFVFALFEITLHCRKDINMPAIMLTNNNDQQILNPVPTESPDLSVDLQYLTVIGIFQTREIEKPPGTNKINKPSLYLIQRLASMAQTPPYKANHW